MNVSDAEKQVYMVDDCYVIVNGIKYPVSGFTLILQHNMWPTLLVTMDPYHEYTNKTTGKNLDAVIASLAMFTATFSGAQKVILDTTKRKSTFYCRVLNSSGSKQELKLNDWLLTGAGITGEARGGFQIELCLEHPLRAINESTINFYGIAYDLTQDTGINDYAGIANVLVGLDTAMAKMITALEGTTPPDNLAEMYTLVKARYSFLREAISNNLRWGAEEGTTGWPYAPFGGLEDHVRFSIFPMVTRINNSTGWGWFAREILSGYSLSIVPTFWDTTLAVVPFEPWGPTQITIYDTDISQIQLPSTDSAPVCGVLLALEHDDLSNFAMLKVQTEVKGLFSEGVAWMEAGLPGGIPQITKPSWLGLMLKTSAGQQTDVHTDDGSTTQTAAGTPAAEAGESEPADDKVTQLRDGYISVAKEFFLEYFRQGYEIALNCRFMLSHHGNAFGSDYLVPGCVCEIIVDPANTTAGSAGSNTEAGQGAQQTLRFFATKIVHKFSRQDNIASTTISGQYLRDGSSVNLKAIPNGVGHNPLYTAAEG